MACRWRRPAIVIARLSAMVRGSVRPTVLLGPIGSSRGVGFAEIDLAPLAEAANRAGGTVNDALLAAVAAATAAGLRARGQPVPPVLPASVPVSLPERAGSGNAVGVMMVELPTGEPDTTECLARIAQSTRAAKNEARASGTFELTRTQWWSRVFAWLARRQRFVVMFVTNVRGPATVLAIGGAPLLHAWPVTPIQGNVRLGVSALSYRGGSRAPSTPTRTHWMRRSSLVNSAASWSCWWNGPALGDVRGLVDGPSATVGRSAAQSQLRGPRLRRSSSGCSKRIGLC